MTFLQLQLYQGTMFVCNILKQMYASAPYWRQYVTAKGAAYYLFNRSTTSGDGSDKLILNIVYKSNKIKIKIKRRFIWKYWH